MLKYISFIFLFLVPCFSFSQIMMQTQADAVIGLDRKAFLGLGITSDHSDGYAHDFTLPASTGPCQKIVGINVVINLTGYSNNNVCPHPTLYYNLYYGCGTYSGGATCLPLNNLIAEPNFAPNTSPPAFNFGCPLGGPINPNIQPDFGDNLSVDIIPVSNPGCNPVANGHIAYQYTITVTVTVQNISCSGTGCLAPVTSTQACDDGNPCTSNDMRTILNCDGSICVPCAGTVSGPPPTPTFTQLGPYCQNATPGILPLSSNNAPPITGTWSPAVVSTSMTGTQTYTFTPDAGQCAATATMDITITAPPMPTFTQLGPYCQNTTPGALPFSSNNAPPITGTWSPAVVSTSTVGMQMYTFTPTTGQCATTATMNITISTPPTPTFAQLGPYCQNTTPGALPLNSTNSPPIAGTWSPAVVSTSTVGMQMYTFTPTAGQCGTTATMSITISTPPTPTFAQLGPYCQNTTPGTLPLSSTNAPPITGTWSPIVISTSTVGTQVYTFTPTAGQCGTTTTMSITISTPPPPTFTQLGPYCQNTTPGTLPLSSTNAPPITGTWSPVVISTSTVGTQVYTFTPTAGQCGTTTTMSITISTPPTPTFTQLGPYCQNTTPGTLPLSSANAPPITGTWSPAVISTSTVGTQVYTFTPTAGQCGTTTTMSIIISALPTPTFTQLGPFCQNEIPGTFPLSSTNSPSISGTWSPVVVSTSTVGTQVYTFTPSAGQCGTITTMMITVTAPVNTTFDQLGPYCENATPDILSATSTNSPFISGTWSPSIISTSLVGSQLYTFTPNAGECGTQVTMTIVVTAPALPTFDQLGPYCFNAIPDVLATLSNNFPQIAGTWSPAIINTSAIGSIVYTFTPSSFECTLPTTMIVDVSNSITPTFAQLGPYCVNSTPGNLMSLSSNGIAGTWTPSTINTSTTGSIVYTFTPNGGQCGTSTTMTIMVTSPPIPIFAQFGPYCQNALPGILPSNSTNAPLITGTWSPSVINTSAVGSQIYTFTPGAGQCGTVTTMTIVITAPVIPTFAQLGPYCQNGTPGSLPLISNNTIPISGTWSPGVINTSTLGSTVYTFTPNVGQCASTTSMTIVISTPVIPSFVQFGPYCLNATPGILPVSSTNTSTITGAWSPAVVNTAAIGSSVYTFTPLPGQCALPTTMTIVVSNSITPTFAQLGPYCQNVTSGALPTSSTNLPPISGTWSPAIVSTSTVGTQTYTFTPAAGQCGTTTTMSIIITAAVTATFAQLGPYCQNATPGVLTLISTNSPAMTGTWSPSVINTSAVGNQIYTFTPGAGQCGTVTTMTIVITAPVMPTFVQLGPYCQTATPGALPTSSNNSIPIAGIWSPTVISTSTEGSQVYTFTPNAGQCGTQVSMTIEVIAPILPTFGQLGPYCLNAIPGVLPVSSTNTIPITGIWSPSVVNTSAIGSKIYTFTPSAGQCAISTTMTIVVSNSITPTFNQLGPFCINSTPSNLTTISVNGIAGIWSPSTINTSATGSFVHTFTPNGGQCGTSTTMTIMVTAPPTPTFAPLGPYCQNAVPGILPSNSTNALPIIGTWSSSVINTSTVGTQIYTFTPGAGQCGTVTTMTITITAPAMPTFVQLGPYCQNATPGSLPLISNNTIPISGAWSPGVINTSALGSTVYTFTPNAGQCASNATMTLTITNPVLPLFSQLGPYCQNTTPGVLQTSSSNTPTITGAWSPSIINTSIIGTSVYTFTPAIGQCTSVTRMNVTISAPPLPTFSPLGPYCKSQTPDVLLTSSNNTPPITGSWNPLSINTALVGANMYTFTPTPGQCGITTNMVITVLNGPTSVATNVTNTECEQSNGAVTIGLVTGGVSPYTFNFNNLGFGSAVNFTNITSGSYALAIKDDNGCTFNTLVIVSNSSGSSCGNNPKCEVIIPCNDNNPCTENDVEIQLLADGSICKPCAGVPLECKTELITIQPCDDGDPSTIIDTETVHDCDGSICVPCKGQPGLATVFIPNVFSPNDDGKNDYFMIYGGPDVKIVQEFKIYDRWGSNLFSAVNIATNDEEAGWDGIYKGAKVGPGVYVYFVKIEFFDGQVKVRNGTITIAW